MTRPTVILNIRIDPDIRARVNDLAASNDLSTRALVEGVLDYWLNLPGREKAAAIRWAQELAPVLGQ